MLLIHGMWGSPDQWNEFLEYFKERNIKAKAIDYKKKEKAGIMYYVNEVAKHAKNEILVGHSMGGLIVQKVAEMVDIKAGIAIGSAPPKGIKFGNVSLFLSSIHYIPAILLNRPFKPSYKFVKKYIMNCIDEERAREIYEKFGYESPRAAYEIFMGKVGVNERKIKAPLLFIAGKYDRIAPAKLEEKIARKYNAELNIVNSCHWIFDSPYEIGEKIIEFISNNL